MLLIFNSEINLRAKSFAAPRYSQKSSLRFVLILTSLIHISDSLKDKCEHITCIHTHK